MLKIIRLSTILYVIVLTLLLELPIAVQEGSVVVPLVNHAHLITFTLLGFLVELGRCKKSMLFWVSMLLVYAVGTDCLQWLLHPICQRCFDWVDIVNNIVGVFLGTFVGYFCRPLVKRPSETLDKKE